MQDQGTKYEWKVKLNSAMDPLSFLTVFQL